jgi:hypothetical protein
LAAAFLTPDEIFGAPLTADYTMRQLQRVPVEVVLRFCAMVLNALTVPGASAAAVDQEFVDLVFSEPVRSSVLNPLNWRRVRLFEVKVVDQPVGVCPAWSGLG